MGILTNVRILLLCLTPTTAIPGQVDAREIIRHAVVADELNWRTARKYTFLQRVEAEVIDTILVGLFLVRVSKGSHATLELTSAWDGVWLPDRLQVFASARLGLLKGLRIEQTTHYSRYSSVPADARAIRPAEGLDARSAGLSQFAKATP